jgi:hypothetical protein
VADVCWAATNKDVFQVTDDECKAQLQLLDDLKEEIKSRDTWVAKCWTIVTASLHDDIYRKVSHSPRGLLQSLLKEISHALVVNNMEEVAPLRLELYQGNMLATICKRG